MKKMYKVFSLLLTVVMLSALVCIPSVSATTSHHYVANGANGAGTTAREFAFANTSTVALEHVTGFGGKGAEDISAHIKANEVTTSLYANLNIIKGHNLHTEEVYKFILSFNVYPVNGLNTLILASDANLQLFMPYIPGDALTVGRWNRIVCVFDGAAGDYGMSTLSINGQQYGDAFEVPKATLDRWKQNFDNNSGTSFRCIIQLAAGGEVYVDDFTVWKASVTPYTGVPKVEADFVSSDTIAPGTTPAQIAAATVSGPGNTVTVKAYRGGDMTQAPLSEDTALAEGDMVLLEELLENDTGKATFAPDYIRMAYNYYRVTADDTLPLWDMETDGQYQVVRGIETKNVDGFYGKSADEKVLRFTAADGATDTYFEKQANHLYQADKTLPIVFSCDFLAESHVKVVRFSTGGSPMSVALYCGNNDAHEESNGTFGAEKPVGFVHGRWYNLKMVVDYTNTTGSVYVDGVKVGDFTVDAGSGYNTQSRFIVEWDDSTVAADKKFCVDNFKVYQQAASNPAAGAISLDTVADGYLCRKGEISFFGSATAGSVKTATGVSNVLAFDSESNYTSIADGTALADGNLVVLKNDAGSYGYYTVRNHLLAAEGAGYVNDTTYTDGEMTFAANGGTIIVAQYDESGILIKAQVQPVSEQNRSVALEPAQGAVSVRAFVFNSVQGLIPYVEKMDLQHTAVSN